MIEIPEPIIDTIPVVDSTRIFVQGVMRLIPLTLYFHNDEPDKRTTGVTTTKTYEETYDDYIVLRDKYKSKYYNGLVDLDLLQAQVALETLFNDSIEGGMKELKEYSLLMLKLLKTNKKITITIKGYCSPLANTDYNLNLAKRRVSSLVNYLQKYNNGVFLPYLFNDQSVVGQIEIVEEYFGETYVRPNVSSDYYDTRNSVYNPNAAYERKIEIISVAIEALYTGD
jgi:hypothetical protein